MIYCIIKVEKRYNGEGLPKSRDTVRCLDGNPFMPAFEAIKDWRRAANE